MRIITFLKQLNDVTYMKSNTIIMVLAVVGYFFTNRIEIYTSLFINT